MEIQNIIEELQKIDSEIPDYPSERNIEKILKLANDYQRILTFIRRDFAAQTFADEVVQMDSAIRRLENRKLSETKRYHAFHDLKNGLSSDIDFILRHYSKENN